MKIVGIMLLLLLHLLAVACASEESLAARLHAVYAAVAATSAAHTTSANVAA